LPGNNISPEHTPLQLSRVSLANLTVPCSKPICVLDAKSARPTRPLSPPNSFNSKHVCASIFTRIFYQLQQLEPRREIFKFTVCFEMPKSFLVKKKKPRRISEPADSETQQCRASELGEYSLLPCYYFIWILSSYLTSRLKYGSLANISCTRHHYMLEKVSLRYYQMARRIRFHFTLTDLTSSPKREENWPADLNWLRFEIFYL
jgi:hypothetical protein